MMTEIKLKLFSSLLVESNLIGPIYCNLYREKYEKAFKRIIRFFHKFGSEGRIKKRYNLWIIIGELFTFLSHTQSVNFVRDIITNLCFKILFVRKSRQRSWSFLFFFYSKSKKLYHKNIFKNKIIIICYTLPLSTLCTHFRSLVCLVCLLL